MNNEEIRIVRSNYKSLKDMKDKTDDDELIFQAFGLIPNLTKESNRILVYMGAYKTSSNLGIKLTDPKDSDFIMYKDLETCESFIIEKPYSLLKFSKHDKLISLNDDSFENTSDYLIGFQLLRNEFFKELLVSSQGQAVKQLVKGRQIPVDKIVCRIR